MDTCLYPSFIAAFRAEMPPDAPPPYYQLLHLSGDPTWIFDAIVKALGISADRARETCALLAGCDWRLQIIGAMAAILGRQQSGEVVDEIWRAFDEGSWVSPQLAVTASLIDPRFAARARERVERRCLGIADRTSGMSWAERHGASGPNGSYHRACKAISALLEACAAFPHLASWVQARRQDQDIKRMLGDDPDYGGQIASAWRLMCLDTCRSYVERRRGSSRG